MGMPLRFPILAVFAFSILSLAGTLAPADPIRMPTVDYQATATIYGGLTMVHRHSNGKLRVEMQVPGMPQASISLIDLRARKIVTMVSVPGMGIMAMEADFGDESKYGVVIGEGKRLGPASVAGEPCVIWEVEAKDKKGRGHTGVACLTRDSIALRMEATIKGKREKIFEVTELKRGSQDPKLFALPPDVQVMKMPKNMRDLLRQ